MFKDYPQSEQERILLTEHLKQHALIAPPENLDVINKHLAGIFEANKVLAIGENHGSVQQQAFIRILLPKLREFASEYISKIDPKSDTFKVGNNYDALLYHPQSEYYLKS